MATHYAVKVEYNVIYTNMVIDKIEEANVPTIFVNTCETQAKNLATRLLNYTLFSKSLRLNIRSYFKNKKSVAATLRI